MHKALSPFHPSNSVLELHTTENMSTVRALWPALKPLILLLQDSFTMSRRMEKLQGVHAQDAVLLESFGWAPGNVWWQRKMKVLERKKNNQPSPHPTIFLFL